MPPSEVKLEQDAKGRWATHVVWGCGCPKGPVFTLAYVPRTSPLEVRLCKDQSQDSCERGCGATIGWNLDAPMREAGAKTVRVVR